MILILDTIGQHFDPRFTLRGWTIDSCIISTATKAYETAFGDDNLATPHTEYSAFRVRLGIKRDAHGIVLENVFGNVHCLPDSLYMFLHSCRWH